MATRRPLVNVSGTIQELPTGDVLTGLDLASPPAIGGTTPAAGTFTDLTVTGGRILTLPAADHSVQGDKTSAFQAGESITLMDLVYLKSDGKWWKTDADAATTTDGLLGISLETKTANNAMSVALPGSFVRDDTWNWTPGATLYADTTTAGAIVATQPSGTDDAIRVVGWAVSADVIYFAPSGLYFTHT